MTGSLYLDARKRVIHVGLYGSALEVGGEGEVPSLAPLARLRRVCCWGRVQWAGEALIACATRAIPICFLGHGRGIGYFLPARPAAKGFGSLIDDARLHPEWSKRLHDWTESALRRSFLAITEDRSDAWKPIDNLLAVGETRLAFRAGLRLAGPATPWRPVWRHLNECLHAWTIEQLLRQPLTLPQLGCSSDRPDVTSLMTQVLAPLLLPAAVDQARTESGRKAPDRPIDKAGAGSLTHRCTLAFNAVEPRLAKYFARAVRQFESLVRACAEDFEIG
jgi:hypothetical protein